MKKLFTLLTLALLSIGSAWAESYTNEPLTVTWANPSLSQTAVSNPEAAVSTSTWTGSSSGTDSYDNITYTLANSEQTFSFTFTPFPGLTFTPGSIEFDMVKFGSDNCFATVDIVYGDESTAQVADLKEKTDICRNKANVNADKRHQTYNLDNTKASANAITLKFKLKPASGKTIGVANVQIIGTVSGTTSSVTKYTINIAANNDEYGTVNKSVSEVVAGTNVTLTATPNRGFRFANWTDNNNSGEVVSAAAVYTFTPTANVDYTGNFAALNEYSVNVAANNDEYGTVSVNSFTDGKYFEGDMVYPEARPNIGYVFTSWSDGSTDWNHEAISLSENLNLTATFTALPTPLANASWTLSNGNGSDEATVANLTASMEAASKVTFEGIQISGGITYTKVQPVGASADGSDDYSVLFTLTPTSSNGQAFIARSIEFDAIRLGTSGGNFTLRVIRDGVVSTIASNKLPSESGTHYYFNLDDSKQAFSIVVKLTLGGSLATNKQYGFANLKVNGYLRTANDVTATIDPTYGWATFVTPAALDFTGLSDIKAYIVTGHTEKAIDVTLLSGTVPANTPLLLEGATTAIPVIASSTTDVSDNKLKAGTGAAVSAEAGKTKYALSVQESKATFKKITTSSATIPAGKAYLEFAEEISAPSLDFDFGGVTAITNMSRANNTAVGEYYNLAGQRVAQPTAKGLYIVNGKKAILK